MSTPDSGAQAPPSSTCEPPARSDTLWRTRLLLHAEIKFATRDTSIHRVIANAGKIILGKERQIRMAVACLLARGHLLIEDLPGVGKTTLAHTLAKLLGLAFQRISFTSDLLPADIIGVSVFDRDSGSFKFHPGPIFSQLILADEVNRATPKTQSALLEAMEEHQVTAEGETRPLPEPFFVIATQNPSHQVGTFPLPESQLDRFLMRIELGYPDRDAERALLQGAERRNLVATLEPCLAPGELLQSQAAADRVYVAPALLDYVQAIVEHTRHAPEFTNGLSPRAALGMLHAAKAWAMLEGRDKVLPEDVQAILPGVAGHRLAQAHEGAHKRASELSAALIEAVPIP
ncbi:MAG: MoxR family ATPase [Burkholderiales bacterium]|nr:MoxR family ATPase [Burkholderiales bacterium]